MGQGCLDRGDGPGLRDLLARGAGDPGLFDLERAHGMLETRQVAGHGARTGTVAQHGARLRRLPLREQRQHRLRRVPRLRRRTK